jgi:hypothetical protein
MKARIRLLLVIGTALLALVVWWRSRTTGTATPRPPRVEAPAIKSGGGGVRRPPAPASVAFTPPAEAPRREINLNDEPRPVPLEAIERYLERNSRNAASLLAAMVVAKDGGPYLQEAEQRFPDDPRVQWAVLYRNKGLSPEQRREWLNRFLQSAPGNSLAGYSSAREHFKTGDTAAAVRDLLEASQRPGYEDYTLATMQDVEQLYMESGLSVLEAKFGAFANAQLPQLGQLKQLSQEMLALREQYLLVGDPASARAMEQMTLGLADRLTTGQGGLLLIGQLVGVAIERQLLDRLPAESGSDLLGMTAAQRAAELAGWKTALKTGVPDLEWLLRQASEAEAISYFDRLKTVGELEAIRWWVNRQGQP